MSSPPHRYTAAQPRNRATAQPRNRTTAQPHNRTTAQPHTTSPPHHLTITCPSTRPLVLCPVPCRRSSLQRAEELAAASTLLHRRRLRPWLLRRRFTPAQGSVPAVALRHSNLRATDRQGERPCTCGLEIDVYTHSRTHSRT